jgi:hypothetical protein
MGQTTKQGMGCFAKFCLIVLILALIGGAALGIGSYFVVQKIKEYTSDKPSDIPIYAATSEQFQQVIQKIGLFAVAVSNNVPAQLQLNANEINTVISMAPGFEALKGKCRIQIASGKLSTEASISLDALPGFKGRYLNGIYSSDIGISNGKISLTGTTIEVKGAQVPKAFIESFQKGMVDKLNQDPRVTGPLSKVQLFRVDNDSVIVETVGWDPKMINPVVPASMPQTEIRASRSQTSSQSQGSTADVMTSSQSITPPPSPSRMANAPTNSSGNGSIVIEGYDPPAQ